MTVIHKTPYNECVGPTQKFKRGYLYLPAGELLMGIRETNLQYLCLDKRWTTRDTDDMPEYL